MYHSIVPSVLIFLLRISIILSFVTSVTFILIGAVKLLFSKDQKTMKSAKKYLRRGLFIFLGLAIFVMIIVAIEQNVPNAGMGISKPDIEYMEL